MPLVLEANRHEMFDREIMNEFGALGLLGSTLPEKVLTNFDLEKVMDTSDQWIRERTGIERRHIAADGETTVDMAERAARAALGPRATQLQVDQCNRLNGYDLPWWDQLYQYVRGLVVHLNLGYSYKLNQSVLSLIGERLPKTLVLVGISTALAVVVAIPLGILQVVRRNRPIDYSLTGLSFLLYAMPAFFLGTLLIIWFSFDLHLLPVAPPPNASREPTTCDPSPSTAATSSPDSPKRST